MTDKQSSQAKKPYIYSELSKEEFDAEIEKGMASMRAGRGLSSKEVRERILNQQ